MSKVSALLVLALISPLYVGAPASADVAIISQDDESGEVRGRFSDVDVFEWIVQSHERSRVQICVNSGSAPARIAFEEINDDDGSRLFVAGGDCLSVEGRYVQVGSRATGIHVGGRFTVAPAREPAEAEAVASVEEAEQTAIDD